VRGVHHPFCGQTSFPHQCQSVWNILKKRKFRHVDTTHFMHKVLAIFRMGTMWVLVMFMLMVMVLVVLAHRTTMPPCHHATEPPVHHPQWVAFVHTTCRRVWISWVEFPSRLPATCRLPDRCGHWPTGRMVVLPHAAPHSVWVMLTECNAKLKGNYIFGRVQKWLQANMTHPEINKSNTHINNRKKWVSAENSKTKSQLSQLTT